MRRREFITALCGAAAIPLSARAQGSVHRVGVIMTTSPIGELIGPEPTHALMKAFVAGLRELGYVEGRNLVLERHSAEGKFDRFRDLGKELVENKVDVM